MWFPWISWELLGLAFVAGVFTPVLAKDWGKCSIILLSTVIVLGIAWQVSGVFMFAASALSFALGTPVGFETGRRIRLYHLGKVVNQQIRVI